MLTRLNYEFEEFEDDPLSMFIHGLKAKETKRQYPRRLKAFMDYCDLGGIIEEQATSFDDVFDAFRLAMKFYFLLFHEPP
jgi:hypothetical protein